MDRGLGGVGCLGVYAEKDILIGGTMRGKLLAIEASTGKLLRCIVAHKHTLSCLSIDQNLAVTGSWDTTLRVWDLDTYSNLTTLERPGEIGYIRCCQIDKSRGMVVSGSNDNSVKLWDLETSVHLDTIRGHEGAVTGLTFKEDRLVTGSWDKTVRMWSLKDKECTLILRDTSGDKYCSIRYDPVRELVYGGREDQHIAVFDLRAGKMMCRLTGHSAWVYGLALDGSTLFSGSMDGKVRVWDREKNECYNELNSVGTSCVHALLSYDNILYSANEDSSIRAMDFSGPTLDRGRRTNILASRGSDSLT
jgi:WD40 repeat protein